MNRVNTYLQGIAERVVRLRRGGNSPISQRQQSDPPEQGEDTPPTSPPSARSADLAQLAARIQARVNDQAAMDLPVENDLAMLMIEEDRCREATFDEALLAPRKPRKAKFTGAHVSYELARRSTTRFFCCSGCNERLFRPQDVLRSDKATEVAVTDSDTTFCLSEDAINVGEGEDRVVHSDLHVEDVETQWTYTARSVTCPSCKLYLGVKVISASKGSVGGNGRSVEDVVARLFGFHAECSISIPNSLWLSVKGISDQKASSPVSQQSVGQVYIASRYLRIVDAHTGHCLPQAPQHLVCTGCKTTLSYSDQIMCYQRRWGFGEGVPEPACYMNSIDNDQVTVGEPYQEHLGQGPFMMSDVWCNCGKQVGYKFIEDRSASKRNRHFPGRFGLVNSCVEIVSEEDLQVCRASRESNDQI
jgi:hypothetical protein